MLKMNQWAGSGANADIAVANADGSGAALLTDDADWDAAPCWSPDGAQIAFQSTRSGGSPIHVIKADGSGLALVGGENAERPIFSPDGSQIAYGDGEIRVMNLDGSGAVDRTADPASWDDEPHWR